VSVNYTKSAASEIEAIRFMLIKAEQSGFTNQSPQELLSDIKKQYRNASFVANNRVVFNIHGNTYRLVVAIKYQTGLCYIRFIGTHREYDEINVVTV
jgi:mRNA-degrading endonuclease HigB of HigAB toxin-antitoxin module